MKKLILSALVLVGVYIFYHSYTSPGVDPLDPWILGGIGVVSTIAVIGMVLLTRVWTVRGIGLLYMMAGIAVYALGSLALYRGWTDHGEWVSDALRTVWSVGAVMFAYGLISLGIYWWQCRRDPACTDTRRDVDSDLYESPAQEH